MRAGLNWNRGKLAASGIVNHISGSTDNTGTFISGAVNDGVPVGSWTTLDAQFSYDTRDTGMDSSGLRISLARSEEHTSELQSLMRISYAVFCLKKQNANINTTQ